MHDSFIPFAVPEIGEEEIQEVVDTLRSGWITTGPKTLRFEQEFAARLGGDLFPVAVNSATAGLHLALEAIGVGAGDEVIVPSHTFTATAEVVRYMNADPVFVDIDPATYCISAAEVAAAVTTRTRAMIPVHYAGLAAPMAELQAIAAGKGIKIVEDAAHAFPTLYAGRTVGSLETDATVFSFYATKTIATGEGGMLVTRNPDIARRARIMRLHGIDRDAFDRYTSTKPAWYYEVVAPGFKYNLTDVAAAIGLQQLRKADRFLERRTQLANRYCAELRELPVHLPPTAAPGSTHAWHLFVIALANDAPASRDEVVARLFEAGIGCSVHYVPLHLQPYWRDRYGLRPERFPNSQWLFERCISLPIHTKLSDDEQSRVIDALGRVLA